MDARLHVSRLSGQATVPPSKSAAHRAVLCAALADGVSHITNIEYSQDIRATLGAVTQLGAKVAEEPAAVTITGRGSSGGFVTVTRPVFCNESGSTLRFMIPLFSLTAQKACALSRPPRALLCLGGCVRAGSPCRGMCPASSSAGCCLLRR